MYDYHCTHCNTRFERLVPYRSRDGVRCACGSETARVWSGRCATVIPDSIPGGIVIENITKQPKRYYSRSEIKLAQEVAGVKPFVRHVGTPDGDKSKHTSRWV